MLSQEHFSNEKLLVKLLCSVVRLLAGLFFFFFLNYSDSSYLETPTSASEYSVTVVTKLSLCCLAVKATGISALQSKIVVALFNQLIK